MQEEESELMLNTLDYRYQVLLCIQHFCSSPLNIMVFILFCDNWLNVDNDDNVIKFKR